MNNSLLESSRTVCVCECVPGRICECVRVRVCPSLLTGQQLTDTRALYNRLAEALVSARVERPSELTFPNMGTVSPRCGSSIFYENISAESC